MSKTIDDAAAESYVDGGVDVLGVDGLSLAEQTLDQHLVVT